MLGWNQNTFGSAQKGGSNFLVNFYFTIVISTRYEMQHLRKTIFSIMFPSHSFVLSFWRKAQIYYTKQKAFKLIAYLGIRTRSKVRCLVVVLVGTLIIQFHAGTAAGLLAPLLATLLQCGYLCLTSSFFVVINYGQKYYNSLINVI